MEVDLRGRVENLSLSSSNALMPLFEAVINALQAIEDKNLESKGKVEVKILRKSDDQAEMETGDRVARPIHGFEIYDNGIGFNDINFKSFRTSDSRLKGAKGGKGIGRLFWLKAFDQVRVESTFGNQKKVSRKFQFTLEGDKDLVEQDVPANQDTGTKITLLDFKDSYRQACPKRAYSIGARIVEHCLIYFLDKNCPQILLTDEDDEGVINLNQWFKENISDNIVSCKFNVEGEEFQLLGLSLYSPTEAQGKLHWCSNNREVISESLAKIVPNLKGKLKDQENRSYIFLAYLSSTFLDKNTNQERTAYSIPEVELPLEEAGEVKIITMTKIREQLGQELKRLLKDKIEPIVKEKKEQIENFVKNFAPQYRALVKLAPEALEQIPPGLSDDKLDSELHQAQYRLEKKVKDESKEFVKKVIENPKVSPEEREKMEQLFYEKISALNQANLAKYVFSRKSILEFYDGVIKQKSDGSFDKESAIHNLIFPQFKTSDDVGYDQHNLWLLDERLAYHSYLASEKEIGKLKDVESESKERPDVVIFDTSTAFVESDAPYSSVIVVEFKRPGRDDNSKDGRDPIQQMYDYVEEIRAGKRRAGDGQQFLVPPNLPFFAYLVCDLTEDIMKIAKGKGLKQSPDGLGYFGYNENYLTYVEIISYKKISVDAWKRNRVFFDKLGIT